MSARDEGPRPPANGPDATRAITDALSGLRFGEVVVTVHDGRVVQITRVEKVRLDEPRRR